MKYTLEAYYKKQVGSAHEKIALSQLYDVLGIALADRIIIKAADRMLEKTLPKSRHSSSMAADKSSWQV